MKWRQLLTSLKLGFFVAVRQIRRSSRWTNILIISVMTLTFLNLVVVTGILVGLIESASAVNRDLQSGDIFISTLNKKTYIENSPNILSIVRNQPEVESASARYISSGVAEANYKVLRKNNEIPNEAGTVVAGIEPAIEDATTGLSRKVIEGQFLSPDDGDMVLVGADKLAKYLPIESPGLQTLKDVEVGSKIRLTVNNSNREYTVKGIIRSKSGEVDNRIFMNASLLRTLINRYDYSVNEIAIKLKPGADAAKVKQTLLAYGLDRTAKIQTWEEAEPKFVKDIKDTFALLGNMIGSISLVVASITIFIVIFVNAITRRKYIGILKGIGVHSNAIEISYIVQSLFYAIVGILIGLIILYGGLKPYFDANPINFPFSDGILVAPLDGTIIRAIILLIATIIAGYIPAKIVVKQNTLDAILGR